MADALVSFLLQKLNSLAIQEAKGPEAVGVDQEVENLKHKFLGIHAVLVDAERRRQENSEIASKWLRQLRHVCYDLEDVLDEWNTAGLNKGVGDTLKEINLQVDEIARLKGYFNSNVSMTGLDKPDRIKTPSFVDECEIYGRERENKFLISKLLSESSENQQGLQIISVVGMGGIGKTTLARLSYNDDRVMNHFDNRIWVVVSEPFDELRVAKSIIGALEGSVPNLLAFESLLQYISRSIVGKKIFLVLDDVWPEDYRKWELLLHCLMNGLLGSKILITTRNETVAHMMQSTDIMTVKELSEDSNWLLFRRIAFSGRSPEECEELKDIGRRITMKCRGLPLATKIIGGLLRFKRTEGEWQQIFHSEIWERFENFIFAPLWLSYNDLPYMARRCFSYCAIFPKDFQIETDKLIRLWMAQSYLEMDEEEELEVIGREYFDMLATQAFFQDFERDDNGVILRCQMNGIVHDFAQFLAGHESFTMEVSYGLQAIKNFNLRHIMLALDRGVSFPVSLCSAKKVCSLFIQCDVTNCSSVSNELPTLLSQLTSLRALDLSGQLWFESVIIEIPREIGKLILCRYLNLSFLKIKELPEELCELFNLQTLDISWCPNLKELPENMGSLIKLRHFVNVETSLSRMPRQIESLTNLQTLNEFVVYAGVDDSKACTLACLKNLNHLQGSLSIKNLGSVANFREIEEANLQNKRKIIRLHLNFENDAEESKMFTDEKVPESLQPPPNLEFLEIRGFKGNTRFLDFIMSLSRLRSLNLHNCMYLDHLPPLGKLPFLESLSISSMRDVRVGNKLLGLRSDGASSSSSVIAFPRLEFLKFVNMEEWEEWDCGTKMPCLRFLSLVHCPNLKELPNQILQAKKLEELVINWCPILEKRYCKTGNDWHAVSHIPNIMINFDYVPRGGA